MGISNKITGFDRFMDKFDKKKKQTDNSQPTSLFGNKPVTPISKKNPKN